MYFCIAGESKTDLDLIADFETADDLLWHARADPERFAGRGRIQVRASGRIGPLVELVSAHRSDPAAYRSLDIRPALARMVAAALDREEISGAGVNDRAGVFPLSRSDPGGVDGVHWDQWMKHVENAAVSAGHARRLMQGLIGAFGELQDNVHKHSERIETGLAAYGVTADAFEFVVADSGIGVLASLRQNPEFAHLSDSGVALRAAASDGASRLGKTSGHGYGIGQLFRALAHDAGELRFRSGDWAMTILGDRPSLSGQVKLAQKAWLNGLAVTVRCTPSRRSASESG